MPPRTRSLRVRWIRATDALFDMLGLRPLGILVFMASGALLIHVIGLSAGSIRAEGVAIARAIEHPSRLQSFVTHVFVREGDRVSRGAPLVELSPHFIDQEIVRMELEIEQLINESRLAQARLIVDEERWIEPRMRSQPSRPSLETQTAAYYSKQLEVLETRRTGLLADRDALVVTAHLQGVVARVAELGASVPAGGSVASMVPEYAEEIVAYVPSDTNPNAIAPNVSTFMVAPHSDACRRPGRIRTRGAIVQEAPAQLKQMFRDPVHGLPIHVEMPEDCQLGNGQIVTVDFRLGGTE